MISCGTTIMTDPDEYRARIPGARVNLILTGHGDFKARLTWVNLRRLSLVRIEENLPRIAFLALAPDPIFVSFSTRPPPPFWGGVETRPREIVLHSPQDRIHQRTRGPCRWGLIALPPKVLADTGRALAHLEVAAPASAQFLRPPSPLASQLLRAHAEACRLAETKPDMIAHKEVARALEQYLLHALINCVIAGTAAHRDGGGRQHHAEIMARFEDVLASHCHQQLPMPELCAAVGVTERTLRICCAEFLRMSPSHYSRLRRLNLARTALRRADPESATVAAIAKQHGFSQLGRFADVYRAVFGESPAATMRTSGLKLNRKSAEIA
jgi:AraC-like DNA-binding protein